MSSATPYTELRKILLQIIFWGSIWVLVPLLFTNWEYLSRVMTRGMITFFGVAMIVFVNFKVLLPHFFFRKAYIPYVVLGLLAIALITMGAEWLEGQWVPPSPRRGGNPDDWRRSSNYFRVMRWIGRGMPYFTALLGSALFEIANFANRQEQETAQLRSEKLEAEMKFLRSQINPHFLFNALNNIYTLTVLKSDAAPDQLLKLSGMLRYVLYDCNAEHVPLRREVDYIRSFVELAQLKDSRGLNIKLELDDIQANPEVAPMLFIPFVENALKHSQIENLQRGWITIALRADERRIHFDVKNSLPAGMQPKDRVGGIGLQNVQRRLELLYPDRHRLDISQSTDQFSVSLQIDLA